MGKKTYFEVSKISVVMFSFLDMQSEQSKLVYPITFSNDIKNGSTPITHARLALWTWVKFSII